MNQSLDNHPQRSSDTDHPSEWNDYDSGDMDQKPSNRIIVLDTTGTHPPTGLPENHVSIPEDRRSRGHRG